MRPFSFGKRTFLLAVILGKEHGSGLSDFLMSFILSTSMVSVTRVPEKIRCGGPRELRHLCGPALLVLWTQLCHSAGS